MDEGIKDLIKLLVAITFIGSGTILALAFIIWVATGGLAVAGADVAAISYIGAVLKSVKWVLGLGVPGGMLFGGYWLLK